MYRSPAEFHTSPDERATASAGSSQPAPGSKPDSVSIGPVRYFVGAVVQVQDLQLATRALEQLGLRVTHLPSTGAFLGRRNVTLITGQVRRPGFDQILHCRLIEEPAITANNCFVPEFTPSSLLAQFPGWWKIPAAQ